MNRMNYPLTPAPRLHRLSMATRLSSIVWFALVLFAASAGASPFVYVVTSSQQFGTVDLATGAFHAIGNTFPNAMSNLVWGPDGGLYSLTASGNDVGSLAKINPRTGEITDIGSTGLGFNAFSLGGVRGRLYLTDFSNNLYQINSETGVATPIAATGMPPDPNIPFTFNSDGTFNLCDEGFYGVEGALYATFDSFALDPNQTPPATAHVFVSPALYRIDPSSGIATYVAETDLYLSAFVEIDEKVYAFQAVTDGFDHTYNFPVSHAQIVRLDLRTGKTGNPTEVDASIGLIFGAVPIRNHR